MGVDAERSGWEGREESVAGSQWRAMEEAIRVAARVGQRVLRSEEWIKRVSAELQAAVYDNWLVCVTLAHGKNEDAEKRDRLLSRGQSFQPSLNRHSRRYRPHTTHPHDP